MLLNSPCVITNFLCQISIIYSENQCKTDFWEITPAFLRAVPPTARAEFPVRICPPVDVLKHELLCLLRDCPDNVAGTVLLYTFSLLVLLYTYKQELWGWLLRMSHKRILFVFYVASSPANSTGTHSHDWMYYVGAHSQYWTTQQENCRAHFWEFSKATSMCILHCSPANGANTRSHNWRSCPRLERKARIDLKTF